MDLLENIMVKRKPAGVEEKDLPWWFELYHISWILFFTSTWYFFNFWIFLAVLSIIGTWFLVNS